VWDIARRFGDKTNLLVTNVAQGRDLAKTLAKNNVVLMRGHGFAAAAKSLIDVVRMSVYLPRNARVQFRAMQLGRVRPLAKGEIQARTGGTGYKPDSPETQRAWQYWAERAGCADLLKQLA
jgi:HCOMODA/2-hydroxy-3-carboxy-muconic semialdehyde decarboxylase